jgi:deazaflavin-dependent oxidoreductase (nitroreductase family)
MKPDRPLTFDVRPSPLIPENFWTRIKPVQGIHKRLYDSGKGWIIGKLILLLAHTGRKSGNRYVTPLQYEKIEGAYIVAAGRGPKADWFRNVQADPHVHVRVGRIEFDCIAEPVTDPERAADFLEYRLRRHPLMIGLMMKFAHGLSMRPTRAQLVELGASTPMVILNPCREVE